LSERLLRRIEITSVPEEIRAAIAEVQAAYSLPTRNAALLLMLGQGHRACMADRPDRDEEVIGRGR